VSSRLSPRMLGWFGRHYVSHIAAVSVRNCWELQLGTQVALLCTYMQSNWVVLLCPNTYTVTVVANFQRRPGRLKQPVLARR
jgi:hypothetical protein